jgi:hypothetical protein
MSLLNQQRVRVFRNSTGYFAPERPWETMCPCCDWMGVFVTWPEAVAATETHLRQVHCRFCIDRQMPAGREDVLGELYERCPVCTPVCEHCDGIAVYPTNYDTPTELIHDLATVRLTPVFCDGCNGVVAVIPLDPEVYA